MSINNIKKRLKESSRQDNSWLKKALWREQNQAWLDISFAIAVKILAAFRENKKTNTFPKTQKELALAMNCSPQYVNKLLKGAENLQLETITKIENILNIKLIQVPEFVTSIVVDVPKYTPYNKPVTWVKTEDNTLDYTIASNDFTYAEVSKTCLKVA